LLAFTAPVAAQPAPAQPTWAAAEYNPKPLADDFVLPMPCGGAMAFRRVDTPARENPLEDRQVTLGTDDAETSYSEYVRTDYLLGAFAGTQSHTRYYYIGKYEVTRAQYDAVLSGACAAPTPAARRPAVQLGWFDAVQFTHRYSAWLMTNARDRLPRDGEASAFVRLPTEAEWEFAARGGASVSDGEFRQRVFPMREPLPRYVWFQGQQSAAGEIKPVGLLQPNPLGLFDILGNAAEIVLEPYRLSRGDRLHGRAGGFVVRGGDYQTPQQRIRTAMRIELPHFSVDAGTPLQLPNVGFRVVLATPVTTSLERTQDFRQAWEALAQERRIDVRGDPLALVDALIQRAERGEMREPLDRVRQYIVAERFARNQAEGRGAKSAIDSAASLARAIREYDSRVSSQRALVNTLMAVTPDQTRLIESQRRQIQAAESNRSLTMNAYVGLVLQTSRNFTIQTMNDELQTWVQEQRGQQQIDSQRFGRLFVSHVAQVQGTDNPDQARMLSEILN
jgi:formylglycine-generating enzyme required for sulfatase activity